MPNRFDVTDDTIRIYNDKYWEICALASYKESYFDELTSMTWTNERGYLRNKNGIRLHNYIMAKWYGDELFSEMIAKNWVVDHIIQGVPPPSF